MAETTDEADPGPGVPDPPELASAAERRLRRAVVLTAAAVVALSVVTSLSFWDVVGLPLVYVLLPGLALAQLPLLQIGRIERIPVYAGSSVTILVLGAVTFALAFRLEGGLPGTLAPLPARELLVWSALLTLAGVGTLGPLSLLDRRVGRAGSGILAELLPRTRRERGAFVALSVCAGIGEEMAYRGYALGAAQLLGAGPWLAAVLSSVAFGVLHAYQGTLGTVRTAATGFVLALPVLMTGSIVPAMVAHTLIDLFGGLVLGPRMIDAAGAKSEDSTSDATSVPLVQPDPRE